MESARNAISVASGVNTSKFPAIHDALAAYIDPASAIIIGFLLSSLINSQSFVIIVMYGIQ